MDRPRSCFNADGRGKHGYPTKAEAKKYARRTKGFRGVIYRCRRCGLWHLAHPRHQIRGAASPGYTLSG